MRRHTFSRVALAVGAALACGLVAASAAAADTASFGDSRSCTRWTFPNGVSSVQIDAAGAAGGTGGSTSSATGGSGGAGAEVTETVPVTHGQTLDVCVDVGPGGNGGTPTSGAGAAGGNGGGASGVALGSDFSSPLVVAAGGGGGGGAAGSIPGATGGSGESGVNGSGGGSSSTASGPAAGSVGSPGTNNGGSGGGGGAGYQGGSGGSAGGSTFVGGGGGNGGTDFCSTTCSKSTAGSPHVTLTYTVASPPGVSISAPASGGIYSLNGSVASSFSCSEGAGGPGISSCTDQGGHGSGAAIDTSSTGSHTLTVTAQSADGLSSSSSVTYTVAAAPRIWLPLPANGATYGVGQVVHSYFLCADGSAGPGLKSCVDQNGQASGAAIDSSTVGSHTFTVTATSQDGQVTSTTVTYKVVPVPTVTNVVPHHGGIVTLQVRLYAPGTIDAMNTASFKSFALAADGVQPPRGSFVFGSAHVVSSRAQTLQVRVGLTQAGKLLLRDHRRAALQLWVLYTAPGGLPQVVKSLALRVSR